MSHAVHKAKLKQSIKHGNLISLSLASLSPTLYKCASVCECVFPPGGVAMPSGQRARFAAVCNYETMQSYEWALCVHVCVRERRLHTWECVCVCVYMLPFKQFTCAFMCACVCMWGTRIFETFPIGRKGRPSRSLSLPLLPLSRFSARPLCFASTRNQYHVVSFSGNKGAADWQKQFTHTRTYGRTLGGRVARTTLQHSTTFWLKLYL